MKKLSDKRKHRNDFILAVVVLLLVAAGLLIMMLSKTQGDFVSVKIDGVEKHRYSLEETVDVLIYTGEGNEGRNRLVIENGEAYISEASCPDKICVSHKSISNVNESIVCLPNKVVVEIISDEKADTPDVIV